MTKSNITTSKGGYSLITDQNAPLPINKYYGNNIDETIKDNPYPTPPNYFPRRFFMIILGFWGIMLCYIIRVTISVSIIPMKEEYGWDDTYKGILLAGFFMGYVFTQIPAHFLCNYFGGKMVLLVGLFVSTAMNILVPVASVNKVAIVFVRIVTGLFQGIAFPTTNWLIKKWFPLSQRSTSAAIIWSGVYIGTILADYTAPVIIETVGWKNIFYIYGAIGMAWCACWALLIKDDPKDAWGIHPNEVAFISSDQDQPNAATQLLLSTQIDGAEPVQRELTFLEVTKRLLQSKSMWALLYYNLTTSWGFYLLLMWYPTWVTDVAGVSGNLLSFYIVLPYILCFIWANLAGVISDKLFAKGILRKITLRKIFGGLAGGLPGICLIIVAFAPLPVSGKIFFMTIGISGSGFSGQGANIVTLDMAPSHSSVTMGISNMVATIPGILGNLIAGVLLTKFGGSWTPIFMISSGFYLSAVVVWLIWINPKIVV